MPCPYLHEECGGCRKYVCRAYFPVKQPYVMKDMLPVCRGADYAEECPRYGDAVEWREERRRKSLDVHCPYASNNVCGKPWLWMCKSGVVPYFPLTDVKMDENGRILRDEEGSLVFKEGQSIEDIRETCLSGDVEIYRGCPHYRYANRKEKEEKS